MATGYAYNTFKRKLLEGDIDFGSDSIKVMLLTSSYSPSIDAHEFLDDVDTYEVATGGGYTEGGQELTSKTVSADNADDEGVFDAADPEWTADVTGFTARYAVLFKDTGNPATSPLIAYWDFGADQTPQSMAFTLTINSEGLINLT